MKDMKITEIAREQDDYVMAKGGFAGLFEADETYNNFNREIIRAYGKKYPGAVMGFYNGQAGQDVCFAEIPETDAQLYNFCCDFVIPYADNVLHDEIKRWREGDLSALRRIFDRVTAIKGSYFLWY